MNTTPLITIGIMTHNYSRYIVQAIESVLSQECDDWEMFISDDASTDDTPQVVAPYLSDPRIHYIRHKENLGQANNWRYLLLQGTSPIMTVLHADDYWLSDTLKIALAAFQADPELDMLYGNWKRSIEGALEPHPFKTEAAHRMSGQDEFRYQITRHTWLPSATFISRSAVEATGFPNSNLRMLVDTEYFLRVALRARAVQALSQPLMVYRVHSANATAEGNSNGLLIAEKERLPTIIASELVGFPSLHDCNNVFRRECARSIFSDGINFANLGRFNEGRSTMQRALRLDPSLLQSIKVCLDWVLVALGKPVLPLFRRLHSRRLKPITTNQ